MSEHSVADAARQIRDAFPVTEPPPIAVLRNGHCPECEETSVILFGKRWSDLTVDDLRGNPSPSLFTAPAFAYFLPGLMSCVLDGGDALDCFPAELVGMLSPPRGETSGFHEAFLAPFSTDQATAILGFLRVQAARERAFWPKSDWPSDAVEAIPLDKQLDRAIEYWTRRAEDTTGE